MKNHPAIRNKKFFKPKVDKTDVDYLIRKAFKRPTSKHSTTLDDQKIYQAFLTHAESQNTHSVRETFGRSALRLRSGVFGAEATNLIQYLQEYEVSLFRALLYTYNNYLVATPPGYIHHGLIQAANQIIGIYEEGIPRAFARNGVRGAWFTTKLLCSRVAYRSTINSAGLVYDLYGSEQDGSMVNETHPPYFKDLDSKFDLMPRRRLNNLRRGLVNCHFISVLVNLQKINYELKADDPQAVVKGRFVFTYLMTPGTQFTAKRYTIQETL